MGLWFDGFEGLRVGKAFKGVWGFLKAIRPWGGLRDEVLAYELLLHFNL